MVLMLYSVVTMVIVCTIDLDKVWENTKEISLCTHADPRCTASCIAITTAVRHQLSYTVVINVLVIDCINVTRRI